MLRGGELGKFSFKNVRNDQLERDLQKAQREIERLQYTLYEEFGYQEQVDDFVHEGESMQNMIQSTLNMDLGDNGGFEVGAQEPGYDPDLPDEYQPAAAAAAAAAQTVENPLIEPQVTADWSKSSETAWTMLRRDGPNHLGLLLDGPDHLGLPFSHCVAVLLCAHPH